MKEVVKGLSTLFLSCLFCGSLLSQPSFVTKKKFDLPDPTDTFIADTSLRKYKLNVQKIYDFEKLAVFCKFEEKVAKNSKINMRFRLGSLDYVNYLEQKPNWPLSKSNNN